MVAITILVHFKRDNFGYVENGELDALIEKPGYIRFQTRKWLGPNRQGPNKEYRR
jgi:hypothetical protein